MTTKNILIATLTLVLPALAFAGGTCSADFAAHGTFHVGVEAGCWVFETDSGETYQPIGGNQSVYREGLSGVLTGSLNLGVFTTCMQGPVVEMCDFDADDQLSMVGTLTYEGSSTGCWILETGNRRYLMLSDDPSFFGEGAKIKITGVEVFNIRPLCQVDGIIEVLSFTTVGNNHKANANANCHATYAQCRKTCREAYCLISCEQVYEICLANN